MAQVIFETGDIFSYISGNGTGYGVIINDKEAVIVDAYERNWRPRKGPIPDSATPSEAPAHLEPKVAIMAAVLALS